MIILAWCHTCLYSGPNGRSKQIQTIYRWHELATKAIQYEAEEQHENQNRANTGTAKLLPWYSAKQGNNRRVVKEGIRVSRGEICE